ncbi:MAG: hypothetical protein EAX86_07435 [Candidatus Heimdallarchaeota archaeon]|nr:hypothetical protein [Candidatus Heimdallarchaeota archaeon]
MNTSLIAENNPFLEYIRPRGKIVFIGDNLSNEMKIVHDYLSARDESRLPLLLLTPTAIGDTICDQVVTFDSVTTLSQIQSLLNSYFLIFIFNSSDEGTLRALGGISGSIKFSGSIPLFIDVSKNPNPQKRKLFGPNYFNFDFSDENGKWNYLIFIDCVLSSLTPSLNPGVSFPDLMCLFGASKSLYYGISAAKDAESALEASINQIGEKLVTSMPEELESLEAIFISISSSSPLNLHDLNLISKKVAKSFGDEFEIYLNNIVNPQISSFTSLLIITDLNSIDDVFPKSASLNFLNQSANYGDDYISPINERKRDLFDATEEDERFRILGKIFSESEVYIFDDGGLPLFASHRPAGQEVCLYTGLFSAIQSMSSDLIGHTPDHLTAGDKRCVFTSVMGPANTSVRGVAICKAGNENLAKTDLALSMKLVKGLLEKGEPEYSINDKIQALLVQAQQNGTIDSILNTTDFHAS